MDLIYAKLNLYDTQLKIKIVYLLTQFSSLNLFHFFVIILHFTQDRLLTSMQITRYNKLKEYPSHTQIFFFVKRLAVLCQCCCMYVTILTMKMVG